MTYLKLSIKKLTTTEIKFDYFNFSHTRPTAIIKAKDKLLFLNVKGVRATNVNDETVIKNVTRLASNFGTLIELRSCTRDLYDSTPIKTNIDTLLNYFTVQNTGGGSMWYTVA